MGVKPRLFTPFSAAPPRTRRRAFDVVSESLRSDIRTVAEGFVSTSERIDRIESAMSEKFGELEAMIRLSFGELAQRIH